jgi:hypothetical protein
VVAELEPGPENEDPANEKPPDAGGLGNDTEGGAGPDEEGLGLKVGWVNAGMGEDVYGFAVLVVLSDDACGIDAGADTFAGSSADVAFDSLFLPEPLVDSALARKPSYFVFILCSNSDRSENASLFNAASILLPSCCLSDSLIPLIVL